MLPPAGTLPANHRLLKAGETILKGDLVWDAPRETWVNITIPGCIAFSGICHHYCRPLPSEKQTDKEWLNPWD